MIDHPKPRSGLAKFVLPEESLSLKLVFENVQNYLICGGLLAGVRLIEKTAEKGPESEYLQIALTLATFVLTVLTALQTDVMLQVALRNYQIRLHKQSRKMTFFWLFRQWEKPQMLWKWL